MARLKAPRLLLRLHRGLQTKEGSVSAQDTLVEAALKKEPDAWSDEERLAVHKFAGQPRKTGWPRYFAVGDKLSIGAVEEANNDTGCPTGIVYSVSDNRLVIVRKGYVPKKRGEG